MKAIKNLKNKVKTALFNWSANYYQKEIKTHGKWSKTLNECVSTSYSVSIKDGYENYKLSIYTPIECIYFAIKQVYGDLIMMRILGVSVDYISSPNEIIVHITAERPGMIIGFHGKDVDKLTEILTKEFGQTVKINIKEDKQLTNITYCNY